MTRNRELECEDLFGCDHTPETPVSEDGEIIYWLCRCGRRHYPEPQTPEPVQEATQERIADLTFGSRELQRATTSVLRQLTPKEQAILEKRFPGTKR